MTLIQELVEGYRAACQIQDELRDFPEETTPEELKDDMASWWGYRNCIRWVIVEMLGVELPEEIVELDKMREKGDEQNGKDESR